jgi:hypothetical protein
MVEFGRSREELFMHQIRHSAHVFTAVDRFGGTHYSQWTFDWHVTKLHVTHIVCKLDITLTVFHFGIILVFSGISALLHRLVQFFVHTFQFHTIDIVAVTLAFVVYTHRAPHRAGPVAWQTTTASAAAFASAESAKQNN